MSNNIKLLTGRSNQELANKIAKKLNISLVKCILDDFPNSEIKVQILENVRGSAVYIIQTAVSNETHSINDYLMELKLIANACKLSSAKSISAIIPCFPYARSDKKDVPRVPIGGALVANELKNVGIKRIISVDLHAGQIQGFTDMPFDNLYGINVLSNYLNENYFSSVSLNDHFILVSPDNGGVKRVEAYAQKLGMDFVTMHKQRDYTKKSVILKSMLIGKPGIVRNKNAIIIDDIVDTMGTMVSAAEELKIHGVIDVIIIATHGIFSDPAFTRINNCNAIKTVIISNTLPQEHNLNRCNKLKVVDMSDLFAEVIKRLQTGKSISELFKI